MEQEVGIPGATNGFQIRTKLTINERIYQREMSLATDD